MLEDTAWLRGVAPDEKLNLHLQGELCVGSGPTPSHLEEVTAVGSTPTADDPDGAQKQQHLVHRQLQASVPECPERTTQSQHDVLAQLG